MTSPDEDKNKAGWQDGSVLDRSGALEVRLATTEREVEEAQRLRYEVFYREMSANPTPEMRETGRDFDEYDPICDHLLVVDHDDGDKIVATYRLLQSDGAARSKGFYTAGEYDISAMLRAREGQKLLELGRSCVLKPYRNGPTMQLLWRGLLVYLIRNDIALMFGCASLPGTDPAALALQLSYLYHFHLTPEPERVRALPERFVSMNLIGKDQIVEAEALHALPPLVKGYLRTGASIGDGAVIDHQFDTTDVFIYLPVASANPRLIKHLKRRLATPS
ncbi:MAG: GNAT family N-acetyltransferase [Alphaproteobacteria bacterium]|nr:GNAT family N-acetyltransferase [Alphaproteobacteria bacterium]